MSPERAPAGRAGSGSSDLLSRARAWIEDDPDPGDREELESLVAAASAAGSSGAEAAAADLADRFSDRLHFGTAGLRGAVGAGPNRMNRAVVRATTAALAAWLARHDPASASKGVVIGCDARHRSSEFADEATAVLAGAGVAVHRLADRRPTPLLAFAVRHLGASAGVMITASHNPPADNGYKLYLSDGAQIVPPVDAEIERLIGEIGPLGAVPLAALDGPLVTRHWEAVTDAYLEAVVRQSPAPPGGAALRVAYTPLHGVAGSTFLGALRRAGFADPAIVAAQAEPDPAFPTVAFPNPEEPGALDLVLDEARRTAADVVVANDPDGDRLAVAVPDAAASGGWRALSGDQLGWLLGAFVLERTASEEDPTARLVATTIVSSSMLGRIAAVQACRYAETLTGFKWIVRAPTSVPGSRFVFGYEEALGYSVGTVVRDKDGIGAALAFLGLVAEAGAAGRSVLDLLDDLERRHGVHLTAQMSLRSETPDDAMVRLRSSPPAEIGGRPVESVVDLAAGTADLPPSDVLVYRLPTARVVVRPSGTEPKLKVYFEVVRELPGGTGGLGEARAAASAELAELRSAMSGLLG